MACSPERYANLPIKPQYKQALLDFCQAPGNEGACEELCSASDEEIIQSIDQIEGQLQDWIQNGVPDELKNADPNMAQELDQFSQTQVPSPVEEGIGALAPPQAQAVNPSVPPGQLARVPMPMDVPSSPPSQPAGYRNGGFVNAPRFGLGGLFKGLKKMFSGPMGSILGGIVGAALAPMTGGMSLALGAGLGSAAGTLVGGGDLRSAITAGVMSYGMGAGIGKMAGAANASMVADGAAGAVNAAAPTAMTGGGVTGMDALSQMPTVAAPGIPSNTINPSSSVGGLESLTTAGRVPAAYSMPRSELPPNPMGRGFQGKAPPQAIINSSPYSSTNANIVRGMKVAGKVGNYLGKQPQPQLPQMQLQAPSAPRPPMRSAMDSELLKRSRETQPVPVSTLRPIPSSPNPGFSQLSGGSQGASMQSAPMIQRPMGTSLSSTSPIDAYYECLRTNGPEACQMPSELQMQRTPTVSIPSGSPMGYQSGGYVDGPGTEKSDSQPAWLSDNEFVMTADAVRGAGNGDIELGAQRMYELMAQLEQQQDY
jgi:hypothetical protein